MLARKLVEKGFEIAATDGTAKAITDAGVPCKRANKVREGRPHIVDMIKNDEFAMIVNTTEGKTAIRESNSIRREAVHKRITYYTTLAGALATCEALDHLDAVEVNRLQDLHKEAQAMKRTPMTLRGAEALRNELKRLKGEDRPRVIKAIAEARSHGDLSENAEYHAAREQQGFIEGRIGEIEAKLSTAEVIDTAALNNTGKVIFGATVDLEDQDDGKRISYQIVGEDEADIKTGRISITSPIARAIVGKSVGRRGRRGCAGRQAQLRSDGSPLRLVSRLEKNTRGRGHEANRGVGLRAGCASARRRCVLAQEWIPLQDGKSLAGWKAAERPESWVVEDGVFVSRGERSHLFYVGKVGKHDFRNFEFSAEVMTSPGANSGIYVHTKWQGPGWPEAGYELQVINSNPPAEKMNGYIEHKMTGSIYAVRNTWKAPAKDNEWFNYRIRVVGKTIQTFINDKLICEYAEARKRRFGPTTRRAGC